MSKKIIAIAAGAIIASTATADIQLTENLAVAGFVDMSWTNASQELETTTGATTTTGTASADSFAVDQVEFQFMFDFDKVTGEVHIQAINGNTTTGGGTFDSTEIETAFATYHFSDTFSVTGGRYFSFLGFEAEEPTGLYQYSLAYDMLGLIPGHNNGVKFVVEGENGFFGVSFQDALLLSDEVFGGTGGNQTGGFGYDGYGIELAGAFTGVEGLTLFAGLGFEGGEQNAAGGPAVGESEDIETWMIDLYAVYEVGALTLAAEFFYATMEDYDAYSLAFGRVPAGGASIGFTPAIPAAANGSDVSLDYYAWQLLANFAFNDQWAITGRISGENADFSTNAVGGSTIGEAETLKLTVSPSYAWSDNLLSLFEYSYTDFEQDLSATTTTEGDEHLFAFETIFSW